MEFLHALGELFYLNLPNIPPFGPKINEITEIQDDLNWTRFFTGLMCVFGIVGWLMIWFGMGSMPNWFSGAISLFSFTLTTLNLVWAIQNSIWLGRLGWSFSLAQVAAGAYFIFNVDLHLIWKNDTLLLGPFFIAFSLLEVFSTLIHSNSQYKLIKAAEAGQAEDMWADR